MVRPKVSPPTPQSSPKKNAQNSADAGAMLALAARADDRPFLSDEDKHDDWRRRWAALRAWFADDASVESRAAGLSTATRAAVSAVKGGSGGRDMRHGNGRGQRDDAAGAIVGLNRNQIRACCLRSSNQ